MDQPDLAEGLKGRIAALRREADILERALQDLTGSSEPSVALRPISARPEPNRRPNILLGNAAAERPRAGAPPSKYAPLLKAWESQRDRAMSHADIFDLAQKTMPEVPNANAVRTYVVQDLLANGIVVKKNEKFIFTARHRSDA